MPALTSRTARRSIVLAALVCTALAPSSALAAPAGAAPTGCPVQPTSQPFAKWGDTADYALAPGGDFESGGSGWSLSNARITSGNDTSGVRGGSRSVALGSSWYASGPSTVVSPPICVSNDHPYFRFSYKPNGPVGVLATYLRYTDEDGSVAQQQIQSRVSTSTKPGGWRPSDLNPLSVNLDLAPGETTSVRLVFITPGSVLGAGYNLDNVFVDPYRRG